jgi:hypothetical protein
MRAEAANVACHCVLRRRLRGQVASHCSLQPPAVPQESDRLVKLLGGFVAREGASAGEQVCRRGSLFCRTQFVITQNE